MQSVQSQYPSCCISGTKQYHDQYTYCCEENLFPCCGQTMAKSWQDERDFCCIEANTADCCCEALRTRACAIPQAVADIFFCFSTCLPVGLTTPIVAGGAWALSCCLSCAECCYTAEKRKTAEASTKKVRDFAIKCCGNGSFYTAATCAGGTKAAACCIPNLLCPEILNMWCWQQEINVTLHKMCGWEDYHEEVCCPVAEVASEEPVAQVNPGAPELPAAIPPEQIVPPMV